MCSYWLLLFSCSVPYSVLPGTEYGTERGTEPPPLQGCAKVLPPSPFADANPVGTGRCGDCLCWTHRPANFLAWGRAEKRGYPPFRRGPGFAVPTIANPSLSRCCRIGQGPGVASKTRVASLWLGARASPRSMHARGRALPAWAGNHRRPPRLRQTALGRSLASRFALDARTYVAQQAVPDVLLPTSVASASLPPCCRQPPWMTMQRI
jgi:hypothetical protein